MSDKKNNALRKILVVDDDPNLTKILQKALDWEGYQVKVAGNGKEAIGVLNTWYPHLVLLDMNMPEINGLETLRHLRSRDKYVSVIFVSGQSKSEDVISGLDAGADDYVTKPFDIAELLSRVSSQLRIKDLNDQLAKANERLQELVDIDDLTGLYNMRSLYDKLDNELDRGRRHSRSVCVLMMDMDHFKLVNDDHDHLFGSYVLSEVGRMISANIRTVDFAARYGGDEFLIVLTETDFNGASLFAERLRSVIADNEFTHDGHSKKLTISLGFAITRAEGSNISARELVRYADRSLYLAKEQGRNRVHAMNLAEELEENKSNPHLIKKDES
ncbi:MAG: diguanylate cyclase [Bdellovibrionaceae bacterium]|jgi:two-component system, cell cycle response regulator|nr:diguanylate cyclase [Pseudobdellovibrionaceae bacterium]